MQYLCRSIPEPTCTESEQVSPPQTIYWVTSSARWLNTNAVACNFSPFTRPCYGVGVFSPVVKTTWPTATAITVDRKLSRHTAHYTAQSKVFKVVVGHSIRSARRALLKRRYPLHTDKHMTRIKIIHYFFGFIIFCRYVTAQEQDIVRQTRITTP